MNYNLSIYHATQFKFFFRAPSEKKNGNNTATVFLEKDQERNNAFKDEFIRCRVCNHKITTHKEKININDSHYHTFANPNGMIFDIGCYKTALGCLNTGPPTEEFSWFKGYSWQVAICASCLAHLGWVFLSANNNFFYGLIIDRLIDSIK